MRKHSIDSGGIYVAHPDAYLCRMPFSHLGGVIHFDISPRKVGDTVFNSIDIEIFGCRRKKGGENVVELLAGVVSCYVGGREEQFDCIIGLRTTAERRHPGIVIECFGLAQESGQHIILTICAKHMRQDERKHLAALMDSRGGKFAAQNHTAVQAENTSGGIGFRNGIKRLVERIGCQRRG